MLFYVVEMCPFMVSYLHASRLGRSDLSNEFLYNITLWHCSAENVPMAGIGKCTG